MKIERKFEKKEILIRCANEHCPNHGLLPVSWQVRIPGADEKLFFCKCVWTMDKRGWPEDINYKWLGKYSSPIVWGKNKKKH